MGGNNLYQYAPNPIHWIDPWGWLNAPNTLPNTPGIYTIVNGNDVYIGSAGIGKGGMNDRVSTLSHAKAQELLGKPGTTVKFTEVDLGTATSQRDRNRILRHFEQAELNNYKKPGSKWNILNSNNPESSKNLNRNARLARNHNAQAKPQKQC